MGQGSATTLGMGVLSDLEGYDQYRLACDSSKDALGGIPGCGQGGAMSFRYVVILPCILVLVFIGVFLSDKAKGGYKVVKLDEAPE